MNKYIALFLLVLFSLAANGQTVLVNDPGFIHDGTEPDGPTYDIYTADISDCYAIEFSYDFAFSLPWEGSGNMEYANENPGCFGCNGMPDNQNGACEPCWDYLWTRLFIDGSVEYEDLIGEEGTTDADQFGSYMEKFCVDGTDLELNLSTQTWSNDESIDVTNIMILCYEKDLTIDSDSPICEGEDLNLTASSTVSGLDYEWTNDGGGTIANPNDPNTTSSGATDGETYTMEVTDGDGCSWEESLTIEVSPTPTISITGPNLLCEGECGTIDITITDGVGDYDVDLEWMGIPFTVTIPNGTTSIDICYNSTGGIMLPGPGMGQISLGDVIPQDGCPPIITNDEFSLTLSAGPDTPEDMSLTECPEPGETYAFFDLTELDYTSLAPAGSTFTLYESNAVVIIDPFDYTFFQAENGTTLWFTVTNSEGCTSQLQSFELFVETAPFLFPEIEVCDITDVILIDFDEIINSDGGVIITWHDGQPNPNNPGLTEIINSGSPIDLTGIELWVMVDDGNCVNVVQVDIVEIPCGCLNPPTVDLVVAENEVCSGEIINLSATLSNATDGMWSVTPNNGTFGNPNDLNTTYNPDQEGTYTFTFTAFVPAGADPECEEDTESVTTEVIPVPDPPVVDDVNYCVGDPTVELTATGDNLTWYDSAGTLIGTPTPVSGTAGTTTFQVTQTVNGCESAIAIITVTIDPCECPNVQSVIADDVCLGDDINVSATIAGGTATGTWSATPAGGTFASSTDLVTTFTSSDPGTYTLTYTIADPDGAGPCEADMNSVEVMITEIPTAPTDLSLSECAEEGENYAIFDLNDLDYTSLAPAGSTFTLYESDMTTVIPVGDYSTYQAVNGTEIWFTVTTNGCTSPLQEVLLETKPYVNFHLEVCDTTSVTLQTFTDIFESDEEVTTITWHDGMPDLNDPDATLIADIDTPQDFSGVEIWAIYTNNGCEYAAPVTMAMINCDCDDPAMINSINSDEVQICLGDSINLSVVTTNVNDMGTWTSAPTGTFGTPDALSTSFTPSAIGDYVITYTTIDPDGNGSCESVSDSIMLVVTDPLTANTPDPFVICAGEKNIDLTQFNGTINPDEDINWYGDAGGTMPIIDPVGFMLTTFGDTIVYAQAGMGVCASPIVPLVINYQEYVFNNPGTVDVCDNQDIIDLTSYENLITSMDSITWFVDQIGDTIVVDPTIFDITDLDPNIVYFSVGEGECASTPLPLVINQVAGIVIDTTAYTCDPTFKVELGGQTFNLENPTGDVISPGLNGDCDTTYTVLVSLIEPVYEQVTITLCPGETEMIENQVVNHGDEDFEYILQFGSLETGCDSIIQVAVVSLESIEGDATLQGCSGTPYTFEGMTFTESNNTGTVTLANQASNGCDSIINVTVNFVDEIVEDYPIDLCQGEETMILGQTILSNSGNTSIMVPGGTLSNGCDSILNVMVTELLPTSSTIMESYCDITETLTVGGETFDYNNPSGEVALTNINGCDSIVNVQLDFLSLDFTIITNPACMDEVEYEVIITEVNSTQTPYDVTLDGMYLTTINDSDLPYTISTANLTGVISLSDGNGCTSDMQYSVDQGDSVDAILTQNELELNAELINIPSEFLDSVKWTPSELVDCDDCLTTGIDTILVPTEFTIEIFYGGGCSFEKTILALPLPIKKHDYTFPNVITSNGNNSTFYVPMPDNTTDRVTEMYIYDRWGNMMYTSTDEEYLSNEGGWNGLYGDNGQDVAPGVYVFLVKIESITGEESVYTGDITIFDR